MADSFKDLFCAPCHLCGTSHEMLDMYMLVLPWRQARNGEHAHQFTDGVRETRHICTQCWKQKPEEAMASDEQAEEEAKVREAIGR